MQTWLGYNATWAGFVAAPSGVVAVLLSPFIGKNIGRFDARMFATIAFVFFGISYRSEEHTSELQSLMRISYSVFCLKKKTKKHTAEHFTPPTLEERRTV